METAYSLLVLPLYLAWYCVGRVAGPPKPARRLSGLAYVGAVLGTAGLLLPLPWLLMHTLLPAVPRLALALWLPLLGTG